MAKIGYYRQEKIVHYKARYLDSLAALFHLHGPCAAIVEYENKLYLSYNSDPKTAAKKSVTFIDNILKNITNYTAEDLLGVYLSFNADFTELVKKTKKHVNEDSRKLLEKFIDIRAEKLKLANKEFKSSNVSDLVLQYKEILEHFADNKNTDQLEVFLRPFQDSTKLYHVFTTTIKYSGIAEILPNPYNLHTERNISHYFPDIELLDPNYIGISRLSCGYCHKYFEATKHGHRGTHGVCDDEWKLVAAPISPQDEGFKNSLKPVMQFDQTNLPMQHRRLSTDNFEKDIRFFNRDQNLLDFKISLNLIDQLLTADLITNNNDDTGYHTDTGAGMETTAQILGINN